MITPDRNTASRTEYYNISNNVDELEQWYDKQLAEQPKQKILRQQRARILTALLEDDNIADEQ